MAMATNCSSITSDLSNFIVIDCLLATVDFDCYVSLCTRCHNWRDATADLRDPDHRFLPC
jgi:hypothetical protein